MNYIGSKVSLLDFIDKSIDEVINEEIKESPYNYVFADLFAGTNSVGDFYKEKGYNVIGNDLQYYSYILGRHILENNTLLDEDKLIKLNEIEPVEGFIYNNYCKGSGSNRLYFSDYNGKKCDAIRLEIERLYRENLINEDEYYFYLASLIESIDRYANTTSVYVSFLKKLKKSASKDFILKSFKQYPSNGNHKMYNKNANDLIKEIKGDILYLDPPYNTRQYSQYYHLLETIALYDYPDIKGVTGNRVIKDKNSKYSSKRYVLNEFEDLIKNADFKYIFVSYNNEGLMTLDEIKNIMNKYGEYEVKTKEHLRYKADSNRKYKDTKTYEYLHCLTKGD